jgi:hypothetical protein
VHDIRLGYPEKQKVASPMLREILLAEIMRGRGMRSRIIHHRDATPCNEANMFEAIVNAIELNCG